MEIRFMANDRLAQRAVNFDKAIILPLCDLNLTY